MIVLYAMTGGYTEIYGGLTFLQKIRKDVRYKRLLPAISKPGPKKNKKIVLRPEDQGLTGTRLLNETLKRFRVNEDRDKAVALILWDDLDCRPTESGAYAQSLRQFQDSVQNEASGLKVVLLFADPEIEAWFCIDCNSVFKKCTELCKALKNFKNEYFANSKYFDEQKGSCVEKFSNQFREILFEHGMAYSKKDEGGKFLGFLNPQKIATQDSYFKQACLHLQNLNQ